MLKENIVSVDSSVDRVVSTRSDQHRTTILWSHIKTRVVYFFRWYVLAWVIPVGILVLWQVGADRGWIDVRYLSSPLLVLRAAIKLTLSGNLLVDIAVSTWRALAGLIIGSSVGFFLGLIVGLSRLGETLLDTTIQMLRTIPFLSILPLVILWFGIEDPARIFLILQPDLPKRGQPSEQSRFMPIAGADGSHPAGAPPAPPM